RVRCLPLPSLLLHSVRWTKILGPRSLDQDPWTKIVGPRSSDQDGTRDRAITRSRERRGSGRSRERQFQRGRSSRSQAGTERSRTGKGQPGGRNGQCPELVRGGKGKSAAVDRHASPLPVARTIRDEQSNRFCFRFSFLRSDRIASRPERYA